MSHVEQVNFMLVNKSVKYYVVVCLFVSLASFDTFANYIYMSVD